MSLMRTLAKVAVGVAIAKGAGHMMNKGAGGASRAGAGGGLGGLLGGLAGGTAGAGSGSPFGGAQSSGGGLQDMLGSVLGGAGGAGGAGGGLGNMLEQLGGAQGGAGGGLSGILGGLAGAAGAGGAGGAGGLMGTLAGALGGGAAAGGGAGASFGDVLNSSFDQTPQAPIDPTPDQEVMAGLMLSAMVQAAKCDGKLDEGEQEKLMGQLGGDIDAQEADFLRKAMAAPIDVAGLVADTPNGAGPQVYAMSVLAIDLDSQAEAKYLHELAQGFGLDASQVNDIHAQLGVPSLYT